MLESDLPIGQVLNLVEEQEPRMRRVSRIKGIPGLERFLDPRQLENRMIERGIKHVLAGESGFEQFADGLPE